MALPTPDDGAPSRGGARLADPRIGALAAVCGLVAAVLGLAVGELAAAVVSPSLSPLSAVGSAVIDLSPPALKDWAIASFGTADKTVLIGTVLLVVAACGAIAGGWEFRRRGAGVVLAGTIGAFGLAAVVSRSLVSFGAAGCAVVATLTSIATLLFLVGRLRAWNAEALRPAETDDLPGQLAGARRSFLRGAAGIGVAAAVAAVAASVSRGGAFLAGAAREALRLPAPSSPAPSIPAGADAGIEGVAPLVTPSRDFYRIDTALVVPAVDPGSWRLAVTGRVRQEIRLGWAELLEKPLVERHITLACVSNEVGGELIGNARWLGWPVRELLRLAEPLPGADMVLSRSVDGFTAGTPLEALTDGRDALLAVGMNGEPLSPEHGFPVRLVVPGLYGFVSATKWLSELKVTSFAEDKAFWSTRGWSERGPIKMSSRIDVPRDGRVVPAGKVVVGGVAWAQQRGVSAVEVRVDEGPWRPANLGAAISKDTWRQWWTEVELVPGQYRIAVRAVDAQGGTQSGSFATPAPDGASGWHTVTIEVRE